MNVDYRHWADLDALCVDLRAHRVKSIRTVLKATDEPIAWPDALHRHGLTLCSVLALESLAGFGSVQEALDYYETVQWDILQLGNESDIDCSDNDDCSSWWQSQQEVDDMIWYARYIMPDRVLIGPGLANGNEHWLDTLTTIPLLDGIAAHPYSEDTIPKLENFIARYSQYGKLYITEYPHVEHTKYLQRLPSYAFCWSKVMHPLGIREDPEKLAIYIEGATPMPEFVLGFADYAAIHPEVGEPVEDEWTERAGVQAQHTTEGILRYYSQSNKIVFFPKGAAD